LNLATQLRDITAENILERLSDLTNHPEEELIVPYREFNVEGKLYYFTPGGFLYRREAGNEEVGASSAATSQMRPGTIEPMMGRPWTTT